MKNIWTIIKKELRRVFFDKKLLGSIILPGLLIFFIYTFMGSAMSSITTSGTEETPIVRVLHAPTKVEEALKAAPYSFEIEQTTADQLEQDKEALLAKNVHLILTFDEGFDFDADVLSHTQIEIFYNPSDNLSSVTFNKVNIFFNSFINEIDPPAITIKPQEIFKEEEMVAQMVSMILPFIIIAFLFQGAMVIGPESIAGEKERGSMATLLVTPTKRSEIALGKVISLSILCIISALSSFIGIIASLPSLMSLNGSMAMPYSILDYAMILLILITTVLVIVGFVSILSALAKNVKEASTYVLPIFILSMVFGLIGMFSTSASTEIWMYCIPILNTIQSLIGILNLEINYLHILITMISNLVVTGGLIFILAKVFQSERIMFSK